ncbi:WD repeat and HMG-box DNA-binding protein 1 isoform X1 [Colossoma macropomum]|uniref:WD repeat and HMG-box DNA-binding protein 1 isoform X1 n=1 Tax=Colossoma macropomum TaxID=42526 RepID=UPI001864F5DF|nr:WD repeat and HMG-box DNA-binding protein 1 isoform X1 [Colossoma macropomum]XP_036448690.1 WD repeat and HMG-box DNA-binding protein 1 isoform X1 [Colossoma macropomum]XP_036448691.1 WD repeat and HMG-box DNA-binding protein 1 isoform X1 [Colossoma macropomum]
MPCEVKPIRYGHSEGHTDVCFHEDGSCIVTCGSDGDVRIWESLDDDDPKSINVGEKAYSVALRNGKLVTAVSNNTVQIHTFPDGDPDGILTRFTTNANHVTFNASGTRVAAGSSDFMVKVIEVTDSSKQKTLRGHDAPVLSVAFDPTDEFLASSSCDGSVAVWSVEDQTQVVNWNVLAKCNDVSNTKSLCRLAWQPLSGKLLAVPVDTSVHLYERSSWTHVGTLSDDLTTQQVINVVVWSPCGKFLAAGTVGGTLSVWDVEAKLCIERQKHERGYTVCGMAWHPSGGQIAFTDTEGCLGLLDGLCASSSSSSSSTTNKNTKAAVSKEPKDYDDLFDEEDADGLLDQCVSDSGSPAKNAVEDDDDDDDDDLMPATGKPRNRGSFLDDDDNSQDTGSVKVDKLADNDGDSAILPPVVPAVPRPVYEGPMPTPPQKAFQPGSTPTHLMHRFMMWNSVGIVRCYNDEQDNAIDVEFHDTAVHHAMHLTNSLDHCMADLSQEAVLLACEGTDELASKLQCLHFSSWDTNKEWMVDLPKGEDVQALCLGHGWAAVGTSAMLLRVFSIGGVQREIFSLPGPVVCLAGHGEQLLIVYHRGTGFDGDQALGVQLLQLGRKKRQIIHGEPLPLSRKSYLAWMGFSAEGTPCSVDSEGVVRMLNRSMGNTWTPVCNTRESCKSKSDHYWVVGIHENPQQLRCIPCKGSRFPPTLPRPAVSILPFKLPLCQTSTEKGQMEEQYWRSVLFHNHFSFLSSSGYEVNEENQRQQEKEQQEALMKMFALSCKLEREFRCVELAEMMTQSVVTLAIRYASRSRRMLLAQRLNELALEKANQLEEEEELDEEPAYHSTAQSTGFNQSSRASRHSSSRAAQENDDEYEEEEDEQEESMEAEDEAESRKPRVNPFSKGPKGSPEKPSPKPVSKEGRVNPFKVAGAGKSSGSPAGQPRVANVLDTMTMSSRKPSALTGSSKQSKAPVLKPLAPKPRSKAQATLLQMSANKGAGKKPEEKQTEKETEKQTVERTPSAAGDNAENTRPKTGFQMWLEENRKNILADNPDLEETEIIKEAMGRFRTLSAEDRLKWTERAKGGSGEVADLKKRKREEEEENKEMDGEMEVDENSAKKKKPLNTSAKLSAFAFNKD